ncbi:MAG: hypothetical protein R3E12_09180 [Candidatus Eisenbacteria bacterium]
MRLQRSLTQTLAALVSLVACGAAAGGTLGAGVVSIDPARVASRSRRDTVEVAAGVYAEPMQVTPHGPSMLVLPGGVLLRSVGGSEETTLDATSAGRVLYFADLEDEAGVEGFTIRNGVATGSALYEDHGGGAFCYHATVRLRECVFQSNRAVIGGGMACDHPSIVSLDRCRFVANSADGEGGGFGFAGSSGAQFTDCVFESNSAGSGGGVSCWVATATFERCEFVFNEASIAGGAVDCDLGAPNFVETLFRGNRAPVGSGAFNHNNGLLSISGCTFWGNEAGVSSSGTIACASALAFVDHTIVAEDRGGSAVSCEDPSGGATLECCDLHGSAGGNWIGCIADQAGANGNIEAAPLFCNPFQGDFGLAANSPCAAENDPGCGQIGAFAVECASVGIDGPDPSLALPITISPNPVRDVLHLRMSATIGEVRSILVLDVSGRRIATLSTSAAGRARSSTTADAVARFGRSATKPKDRGADRGAESRVPEVAVDGEVAVDRGDAWTWSGSVGRSLPSGVYFVEVRTATGRHVRPFVLAH